MICQACNVVDASVQFTEVVGDQKRTHWLCNACAQTRGLFVAANPSGLAVPAGESGVETSHALTNRRCACGTNLVSIRRSGRVGCADCYDTFADVLDPLLRRVHGRSDHGEGRR